MPIHDSPHPQSDQTATVLSGPFAGDVLVVDWFDRMFAGSWMISAHPGVLVYAARREAAPLPFDDEVVLVLTDKGQHSLVHVDELASAQIVEALS